MTSANSLTRYFSGQLIPKANPGSRGAGQITCACKISGGFTSTKREGVSSRIFADKLASLCACILCILLPRASLGAGRRFLHPPIVREIAR